MRFPEGVWQAVEQRCARCEAEMPKQQRSRSGKQLGFRKQATGCRMHLASQAARTRATASSRGTTRLPFTWPHDLGHTCSPNFRV